MIAPIGVSFVTLIGLSLAVNIDEVIQILHRVDPLLLGLAALKIPIQVLFWSLRWHFTLRARQFPVTFCNTISAVMIRSFFNNMTPGAGTGGEPIGAYYLSKNTSLSFKETMASTASERMCQGVVIVGIILVSFVICFPYMPLQSSLIRYLILGLLGFIGFIALMLYLSIFQGRYALFIIEKLIRGITRVIPSLQKKWDLDHLRENLDGFHREFRMFMNTRQAILWNILFTVINWGLDLIQPYLLFKALQIDVPFWLIVMNSTIYRLIGFFSIIPGGAGLLEGVNVGLYAGLSLVPGQAIVAQTILFRFLDAYILWPASGIVTSISLSSITKQSENSD